MRTGKLITRLDRYMFRQLALALIAVTGGLTALIWLVQSLRFVELVVNHGLSLGVFMQLTGLLIPSFVAVILPITTFVVVQFIYQRLAGDREITVMRAAGLSPLGIVPPGVGADRPGHRLPATSSISGSCPPASRRSGSSNGRSATRWPPSCCRKACSRRSPTISPSMCARAIRTGRCAASWWMTNATRRQHATILAERGRLVEGPNGPRVLLVSGSRQEIDHQTGRLNVLTFAQNEIDLTDNARNDGERLRDMTELSLDELLDPHPPNPFATCRNGSPRRTSAWQPR